MYYYIDLCFEICNISKCHNLCYQENDTEVDAGQFMTGDDGCTLFANVFISSILPCKR